MKFKITRAEMWKATIDDRPGGAASVLDPVARAGANLEFALARRAAEDAVRAAAVLKKL